MTTKERLTKALIVLDAYETWEAHLIGDNRAWEPQGMAAYPTLNSKLWGELIAAQRARNEVLHPAPTPAPAPVEVEKPYTCMECKKRVAALVDYNDNGHMVCKPCDDSLNRYFEEEYR